MLEEYPVSFVNNSLPIVAGQLTFTVLRLLSLITRHNSRTVLIFISPRAAVPSVVSVVLLVIGVEKKTCPISRFYDRSDRQPTGLLAFIHSGDNYVI